MVYLRLAILLFIAAFVAALLGFTPLAMLADDGAKLLILVAVVLFLLSFVAPKQGPPA